MPSWVDERLSIDLPVLRAQGEGQHLEFKVMFPENTRDLAKEIAAFATSNQGTILIGVSDSGDLVGIKGAEEMKYRDDLLKRLEGICRGTVKPAITPVAKFAIENELIVLIVNVPKGRQPVYYSGNTPYVRHLSESRPAEPHEVLELTTEYLGSRGIGDEENGDDVRSHFYSDLARVVGEALMYAEQASDRNVNPWLDLWRSEFGSAASELRDLSAQDIAIEEMMDNELREIANALDDVSKLELTLGSGRNLDQLTERAKERLLSIKEARIDPIGLSDDSLIEMKDAIIVTGRRLGELVSRSHDLVESGNIEELQEEASNLGHGLLRIAQYNIETLGEDDREELSAIGRTLHLMETMRIYMDGGRSMQAIVDKISESADRLEKIINELSGKS